MLGVGDAQLGERRFERSRVVVDRVLAERVERVRERALAALAQSFAELDQGRAVRPGRLERPRSISIIARYSWAWNSLIRSPAARQRARLLEQFGRLVEPSSWNRSMPSPAGIAW